MMVQKSLLDDKSATCNENAQKILIDASSLPAELFQSYDMNIWESQLVVTSSFLIYQCSEILHRQEKW